MNPTEVERLMLMSIKTQDDVAQLRADFGISVRNFVFLYEPAEYIFDYINQFGRAPDRQTFELTFEDFPYVEGSSNLAYIGDLFNKEVIRREAITTYTTFIKEGGILDLDARTGIIDLGHRIENIRTKYIDVNTSHRRALDSEAALTRYEKYLAKIRGETSNDVFDLGITPLENLIKAQRGNLIGLFADTGGGKSFFSLRIASAIHMQGHRVVVISPELSIDTLDYRCDSVLSYQMGYRTISNLSLINGYPGPMGMEADYKEYIGRIGENSDWINYDDALEDNLTVSVIESIILTDEPTLIVVDGIYMMDDEKRGDSGWRQVHNICYGLKRLATKYNVIIVMTQQATRGAGDAYNLPGKKEIADGYGFARSADLLISIGENEDSEMARNIGIKKVRNGADIHQVFPVTYNPDIGDIGRDLHGVSAQTPNAYNW